MLNSLNLRCAMICLIGCFSSLLVFSHGVSTQTSKKGSFIKNHGQWEEEIKFRAEIPNGYVFFRKTGTTYLFYDDQSKANHGHASGFKTRLSNKSAPDKVRHHSVKVEYKNCNQQGSKLMAKGASKEYFNYFIGNAPENWVSNVKGYSEISYSNIYEGISIKYYFNGTNLKYDVIIEPNANPSQVVFEISGHDALSVSEGNVIIQTSIQNINEQKPISFQSDNGLVSEIPSSFKVNENEVGFEFPKGYDKSRTLTIDPELVFSSFSGVTADNWGFTAAFDSKGNTYSGGIASIAFGGSIIPPVGSFQQSFGGGGWDVAIFKYDSTGTNLLYGTFLGGNNVEVPQSLVVNQNDELLIFGSTGSSDFPTSLDALDRTFNGGISITPIPGITYNAGSDIFITRISEDGRNIISSTYLGGSDNDGLSEVGSDPLVKNYGDQIRGDIIIDDENNVYLASSTMSTDFPVTNGIFTSHSGGVRDAIVLKLSPSLDQIIWASYLGGSEEDAAFSIRLDAENNVLVAGSTNSSNFPTTTDGLNAATIGNIDGFVTYIDNGGSNLISSTFIGTSADDLVYFADFDSEGNVYLLGQSEGRYPVSNGVYSNPNSGQFVQKLTNLLDASIFSTVFGSGRGGRDISTTAFLVNECDNLYVAGWGSQQTNFGSNGGYLNMNVFDLPVTQNAFQPNTDGHDFYLAVFTANMERLLYATYMGGTVAAPHVDGGTSRFDKRGVVYQSVCSCGGAADDFPTTEGAWSRTNNSFPSTVGGTTSPRCNNAVFKFDLASIVAGLETNTISGDSPGIDRVCLPEPILFTNKSSGGELFEWDFGDGTMSTKQDSIIHEYKSTGTFNVVLRIEDKNTCRIEDFAYTTIQVFDHDVRIMDNTTICQGTELQLTATGASDYKWTISNNASPLAGNVPVVQPQTSTTYFMNATTVDGCIVEDSVLVKVNPTYNLDFEVEKEFVCTGLPTLKFINKSNVEDSLIWDFGDGSSEEGINAMHEYLTEDTYTVTLSYQSELCTPPKSMEVNNQRLFVPNAFSPNRDPFNEYFKIDGADHMELSVVNRSGKEVYFSDNYANNWNAESLPSGLYYYNLILSKKTKCKGWVQVFK